MQLHVNTTFLLLFLIILCGSCVSVPKGQLLNVADGPDYGSLVNWAAHPEKTDKSDLIPGSLTSLDPSEIKADVFFVHPTTYTGKPNHDNWNAPINDIKINQQTDQSTIQFQASIFNQAGRVFAPRYRQAHLYTYYTEEKKLSKKVFDIAYEDVKNAFEFYLNNYNQGRPFIIASHSQGTTHTTRLIRDMIDTKALQQKMVAAYLIGMPVKKNAFQSIKPCEDASDTGCFISWRTFKRGYMPKDILLGDSITVHNPLSWKMNKDNITKESNQGAILRNFDKIYDEATDAQITNGILWASKPKFAFSFLFTRKNYHVADLNFYYMNVRSNAVERVKSFLSGQ